MADKFKRTWQALIRPVNLALTPCYEPEDTEDLRKTEEHSSRKWNEYDNGHPCLLWWWFWSSKPICKAVWYHLDVNKISYKWSPPPCHVTQWIFLTYLGLPMSTKKLRKADLLPWIEKISNKLPGWQAPPMKLAGRTAWVHFVLCYTYLRANSNKCSQVVYLGSR